MGDAREIKYIIPEDAEKTEKTNETETPTEKTDTEQKLEEINNKLDMLLAAVTGKEEE